MKTYLITIRSSFEKVLIKYKAQETSRHAGKFTPYVRQINVEELIKFLQLRGVIKAYA